VRGGPEAPQSPESGGSGRSEDQEQSEDERKDAEHGRDDDEADVHAEEGRRLTAVVPSPRVVQHAPEQERRPDEEVPGRVDEEEHAPGEHHAGKASGAVPVGPRAAVPGPVGGAP
jgi:hypothetical protein